MMRFISVWLFTLPLVTFSQSKSSDVMICGHRGGYYAGYPENSISLFQYVAKEFKGDTVMLEIDLQKSKNGTLYVLHDETLQRTTTGVGKIDEMTDKDLNALSLRLSSGESVNEHLPTFREVLQFSKLSNVTLMLDIKKDFYQEALEEITKLGMTERSLVLTFRWENSEKVAALQSGVKISCLVVTQEDLLRLEFLPIPIQQKAAYINQKTSPEIIHKLKIQGIPILGDVSEHVRHQGKPLSPEAYVEIAEQNKLSILISDFPIEARLGLK